ncbi:MAG: homoserine kinase [Hyphomicrobiaceae bacterium]
MGELRSFKGIAEGVENSNYLVETIEGRFILTLYEKRVEARDLPFFLGLMEHLAERGMKCPLPVRDRQGEVVSQLAGRPAAIITFLEGISFKSPEVQHCRLVGAELARLHRAAMDFKLRRANSMGLGTWRPLFERFADDADQISPGLRRTIESELDYLAPRWPAALPDGVIHGDLFPDNVFFLSGEVSGIIDFYFACNDLLAYDLAICLNAWCFGPDGDFSRQRAAALFEGYSTVRALRPDEIAAIPLLARGAALRFLLTRSHDWLTTPKGALVAPHDPLEYLSHLQVHRTLSGPGDYGIGG